MTDEHSIPPQSSDEGLAPNGPPTAASSDETRTQRRAAGVKNDELPPSLLDKLKISIPGYRLLSVIGRGGQAVVFKAVQETTGKTVAVKLLKGGPITTSSARERFEREVRALAAIDHPNIVGIIDTGQTRHGHGFLVMNYIAGQSLKQLMDDVRLAPLVGPANSPSEPTLVAPANTRSESELAGGSLTLFKKICEAVNAAHMKGITHRDLSPANVIIDEHGEPHVVDFGLARTAFDRFMNVGRQDITVTGQFLGKLAYASPEQAQGRTDQIDIRTDVYALGVILYQILTAGRFPYEVVGNIADVLHNIVNARPTPPSQVMSAPDATSDPPPRLRMSRTGDVNPVIEAIVLKALEKNPANRYQSAGELARDVDNYLAGQPTIARVRPAARTPWLTRRLSATAAVIVLLAMLGGGAYWLQRPRETPARPTTPGQQAVTVEEQAAPEPEHDIVEDALAKRDDSAPAEPPLQRRLSAGSPPEEPPETDEPAPSTDRSDQSAMAAPKLGEPIRRLPAGDNLDANRSPSPGPQPIDYGSREVRNGDEGQPIVLGAPPDGEYDLSVTFIPSKTQAVGLILHYQGKSFVWWVGGQSNRFSGFELVNGERFWNNKTSQSQASWLVREQECDATVHVRREAVSAEFNGLQAGQAVKYVELSLPERLRAAEGQLGVVAEGPTQFHSIMASPIEGARRNERRKRP